MPVARVHHDDDPYDEQLQGVLLALSIGYFTAPHAPDPTAET